jgi:hypothetical protein
MRSIVLFTLISISTLSMAQDNTQSFSEIPEYPASYESGNVVKRLIDGLGYRYYWASEGLRGEDLSYKPSPDARDMLSTLVHLYGLSEMIVNASLNKPNIRPSDYSKLTYEELRKGTLSNLDMASKAMENMSAEDVSNLQVTFKNGENERSSSYWHMINGPISDAIYHVGQIVTFRRTSGNPMNPKVNVFQGKNRS